MSRTQARDVWEQAGLAILLAWVAGFVDAVGYLTLFHVFTAHMSGNTIAAGVHLGQEDWSAAFHRAFPIPLFVAGVALGAALAEFLLRRGYRSVFSFGVSLEALLLGFFFAWGGEVFSAGGIRPEVGWHFYLLAALPALAMGVQNATIRRVGNTTVRTTYISGMVTNFAEEAVQFLFWLSDHFLGRHGKGFGLLVRLSPRQRSFNRLLLRAGIWTAYVVGAILAARTLQRWDLYCLLVPIGCLVVIGLCDAFHPILPPNQHKSGK